MTFRTTAAAMTLVLLCAGAGACRRADRAAVPATAALRAPLPLPDLSRSPVSVRRQLEAAYERLWPVATRADATAAERGESLGTLGQLLMAAEYYEAAERCFLLALESQHDDPRWIYLLGHLYRLRSEPERAERTFSRALELRPNDVATLVWLGNLSLQLNQADRAQPLFERALAQQPNLVSALYGLGRVAAARHDFPNAIRHFNAALAVDARASIIHYPLALAYRSTGDLQRAEAHLAQRGKTEIGPPDPMMQALSGILESAPAYEFRGIKALERGQADQAAELFRRGLVLEPDTASLRHRLGTALLILGDEQAAQGEFDRALQLAPDYAPTHYSLGVLEATKGRYAKAASRFATALTHAPDYLEARMALADMLTATGRPAEALTHFDLVLDVRPHDADATLGRAIALMAVGRRREAADQLSEGAQQHPDRPEFRQALATVARGR